MYIYIGDIYIYIYIYIHVYIGGIYIHVYIFIYKQNILGKIVELMKKDNLPNPQNLKKIDRVRLKKKTQFVDEIIDSVQTSDIIEDNKLVKCVALVITQLLGLKEIKNKKKEEPFWKEELSQI